MHRVSNPSKGAGDAPDFGLVHVLAGKGRGKTTSALGLALRAWGTGARVTFIQFVKSGRDTGEALAASDFGERFVFLPMGAGFVGDEPTDEDRAALARAESAARSTECDVLVLDEILEALRLGLLARAHVERLVEGARGRTELVLTGREAPAWLVDLADYVTEMGEVKHPYSKGIRARRGVEY